MTRIGIAQAGTYLLNKERTLQQLQDMVKQAADKGCELVLFPEAYLGGYPKFMDFGAIVGTRSPEGRECYAAYAESAFTLQETDLLLGEIAKSLHITIISGIIERHELSLYCGVIAYNAQGERLGYRRKLMPTAQERVIWGTSNELGSPFHTSAGRVGALICWENYMPLARMAMYKQGVDIHAAPTVDDRDSWQSTIRHIAREGACFVLSACQYMTREHVPPHWLTYTSLPGTSILIRGGSAIIHPLGHYLCEPVYEKALVIIADLHMPDRLKAGYDLDVAGHYHRPDIFNFSWK